MDKKWLLIVLVALVLIGLTGGVIYFLRARLPAPAAPNGEVQRGFGLSNKNIETTRAAKITSQIPWYLVDITNPDYLDQKLAENGFWNTGAVVTFNTEGKKVRKATAAGLQITIVAKAPDAGVPFTLSGGSFGNFLDPDSQTLVISILLDPNFTNSAASQDIAKRLSDLTLTAIYKTTHPDWQVISLNADQNFVSFRKDDPANYATTESPPPQE